MPSHLADVGIHVNGSTFEETFEALLRDDRAERRTIRAGETVYTQLIIDGAIECWFLCDEDGGPDLYSLELHYNTHRWVDAVCPAWQDEPGLVLLRDGQETYQLLAQVPDAACAPSPENGRCRAQIACFAEEIDHYRTEEAFCSAHPRIGLKSVFPTGQYASEDEEQTARAVINGVVRQAVRKRNALTGADYVHLLLESYAMDFDVLADAAYVPEDMAPGDVLSVQGWLTCRLSERPL